MGTCIDGYIVQYVNIINNSGVRGIDNIEYYEAWKVIDSKCLNCKQEDFDDEFKSTNFNWELRFNIANSIGKNGKIEYRTKLYWISKDNDLYKFVEGWKEKNVIQAGDLQSILADDCSNINFGMCIDKRNFIHTVNFDNEIVIKESIKHVFYILKKKKDLNAISQIKEELRELLECEEYKKYFDVIKEIVGEL